MKPGSCWSMVGSSSAVGLMGDFVRVHSSLDGPVLLSGEPGVGKDRIARLIHSGSLRRAHPFQVVDCSEFFSEELGAELFACSHSAAGENVKPGILQESAGGTCYLARCEEMAPSIQALLREYIESCSRGELRERGFSRLVFSSSRDIASFTRAGLFDRKLFDTFAGSQLALDPLRKRREDLGVLVRHFTAGSEAVFSPDALEALSSYPWPGNHAELASELSRLLRSVSGEIGAEHLSPRIANFWLGGRQDPALRKVSRQLDECMEEFKVLNRLDGVFGDLLLTKNRPAEEAVDPEAKPSGSGYPDTEAVDPAGQR